MRSMLQLLGGVAVAGAVAAGSTAFTAGGLTESFSTAATTNAYIGGTVAHSVTGATLKSVVFTQTSPATAGMNQVSGAALTFDTDAPTGAVVTMSFPSASGTGASVVCTAVASDKTSTCAVKDGSNAAAYYTGFTTVNIGVA